MVAERGFQKEGKRGQRRDIYKKRGGWGRSKSDHNPDLRKGNTGGRIFGYLPADIAVEEDRKE